MDPSPQEQQTSTYKPWFDLRDDDFDMENSQPWSYMVAEDHAMKLKVQVADEALTVGLTSWLETTVSPSPQSAYANCHRFWTQTLADVQLDLRPAAPRSPAPPLPTPPLSPAPTSSVPAPPSPVFTTSDNLVEEGSSSQASFYDAIFRPCDGFQYPSAKSRGAQGTTYPPESYTPAQREERKRRMSTGPNTSDQSRTLPAADEQCRKRKRDAHGDDPSTPRKVQKGQHKADVHRDPSSEAPSKPRVVKCLRFRSPSSLCQYRLFFPTCSNLEPPAANILDAPGSASLPRSLFQARFNAADKIVVMKSNLKRRSTEQRPKKQEQSRLHALVKYLSVPIPSWLFW